MLAIFPEIAALAAAEDFDKLSCRVREYFAGDKKYAPSIDVPELVARMGIGIYSLRDVNCCGILAVKDNNGQFSVNFVYPNSETKTFEHQFLMAHQIGHYLYDVQPYLLRGEWKDSGLKELEQPYRRYLQSSQHSTAEGLNQEQRADAFAAHLLLPNALLKRAQAKLKSSEELAGFFSMPRVFIDLRLEDLGLASKQNGESFLQLEQDYKQEKTEAKIGKAEERLTGARRADPGADGPRQEKKPEVDSQENSLQNHPLEKTLSIFRKLASDMNSNNDS